MNATQKRSDEREVRKIAGRRIVFDGEGFFEDPDDWSEAAARILAEEAGLKTMTREHWRIVMFLRDYYFQNGRAPLNKDLKAGTGLRVAEIEGLFPGGLKYGARRLAGLPNPKSCM
ncbi:MAG: TusE/DsrC/DsvC family sulfur relay protein [Desulfohalobiaceae bacterium]|nr:TusE/DsrC/DsvC family sulfur relay protein [Desulfohalobiaceae bacterium]